MALPNPSTSVNFDASGDDPKVARSELKTNWDLFNSLITHLEVSDITKDPLTVGEGLEKAAPTLRVQLQASPGLKRGATGIAVDIAGTTAKTAPTSADSVLIHDAAAGVLKETTIPNFLKGGKFANLSDVSGSPSTNDSPVWNGSSWVPQAPVVGAATISQSKLKTTTESKTITPNPTTIDSTLATTYLLGVDVKRSQAIANHSAWGIGSTLNYAGNSQAFDLGTSFTNHVMLTMGPGSGSFTVRWRYVQSSPPYDLGDGEVPIFIFLGMKADGTIGHSSIAEDPPWAGNGPTDIMPDFTDPKTGINYKVRPSGPLFTLEEIRGNAGKRAQHIDSLRMARDNNAVKMVEITHAMKNADMALFPHPLTGQSDDGDVLTRVLIDPVSAEAEELLLQMQAGEDIAEIVQDYWTIDNEDLPRGKPPGVMAVRGRWK